MSRTTWTTTATLAAVALLAGCGSSGGDAVDVPTTGRALTAAVIDDIGNEPTAAGPSEEVGDLGGDAVGADVRFGRGARPYTVSTVVAPADAAPDDQCVAGSDGCDTVALTDGGRATMSWSLLDPDEDPGSVTLSTVRGDSYVLVRYRGTALRQDPRNAGAMPVDFTALVDVLDDPTVGVLTTQRRVDQGDNLSLWG
ncbi:MAG: hypothetical protein Q7T56_12885 [Nocardioidaceae bacterium]|nr:hypothetical protein [Nocardioidaceae bacterium]